MKILFLSAIDFKGKSIQVIRKTPEAYLDAGWDVRYIVARDTTLRGNYFYETEINPDGLRIERFSWPLRGLRDRANARWVLYLWSRLAGLAVVFQLARLGARALRSEPADIVYGYEIHGVLALRLLRLFGRLGRAKVVTRFQGTWLLEMLEKRQNARLLVNLDQIVALRTKSDLAIMTDDGTRGKIALRRLRSPVADSVRFWVNGTDIPTNLIARNEWRRRLDIDDTATVMISVSRLEGWKRVDRCLAIAAELHRHGANFVYLIIGDGSDRERLKKLSADLDLIGQVRFVGAIPQSDVYNYMNCADIFLSMYDLSNVGNPLLEAIRMEKIVVTLNNGDTGSWIKHMENGLIYDVYENIPMAAGGDILRIIEDDMMRERLRTGVRALARRKLWTWTERMTEEVRLVELLLEK